MYLQEFPMLSSTLSLLHNCKLLLGGFIQRRCLYPEIYCRVLRCPYTIQSLMLKPVKIQLTKNLIYREKKSSIKILQYVDSYRKKI